MIKYCYMCYKITKGYYHTQPLCNWCIWTEWNRIEWQRIHTGLMHKKGGWMMND